LTISKRPSREKLQPGSWTEAEADAMEGRRVLFSNGGLGTVEAAVGLTAGKYVFSYVVQVLQDGSTKPILLSKADAATGETAFELVP
jgi:hypothetical protein